MALATDDMEPSQLFDLFISLWYGLPGFSIPSAEDYVYSTARQVRGDSHQSGLTGLRDDPAFGLMALCIQYV